MRNSYWQMPEQYRAARMSESIDKARQILQSQPFSRLLDARLTRFENGAAEIEIDIRDELLQQHGFVHGGVISYLADNSLTFAGGSLMGDSVTSEFKINYAKPAIGAKLIARATVLSTGKNQAVCECKIFCVSENGEKAVAYAQGTICRI